MAEPGSETVVTFHYNNVQHQVVLFRGMPVEDIEACLFKLFNLPAGAHLTFKNANECAVPLSSYLPNGYLVHLGLRASEEAILDSETLDGLTSWDVYAEPKVRDPIVPRFQSEINPSGNLFGGNNGYLTSKTCSSIVEMGDLHIWTLNFSFDKALNLMWGLYSGIKVNCLDWISYHYAPLLAIGLQQNGQKSTSLMPSLEGILNNYPSEVRTALFKDHKMDLQVVFDLRVKSDTTATPSVPKSCSDFATREGGLYLISSGKCLYYSPLFGLKCSIDNPFYLGIRTGRCSVRAQFASYQKNGPSRLDLLPQTIVAESL